MGLDGFSMRNLGAYQGNVPSSHLSFEAKQLAKVAGVHTKPIHEIDTGKENALGYYYHYHTYNRNGAHIFCLF